MKYTYTIIIPHKNIPGLLQRCLDSIPQREDLHIIIVDDNSNPEIVDFNKFPGLNRPDCEVIFTKEGKGAGYARNVGLDRADCKWLLFADADDYYTENLPLFLDKYKNDKADIIYFCNNTKDNLSGVEYEEDLMVKWLIEESHKKGNLDPLRYKAYAPWTKMVRKNLVDKNHIRFEELIAANDSLFSVKVGHYADRICFTNDIIYTRTIRKGSLAHSLKSEYLLARLQCGYHVNEFLKPTGRLKEYHSETWSHLLNLRKISWWVFIRNFIEYLYRTPWFITRGHLWYLIKKKFDRK